MASNKKRAREGNSKTKETKPAPKRFHFDESDAETEAFYAWMHTNSFGLSDKVKIVREGVVSGRGLIASKDIDEDEVLFRVPRKGLSQEGYKSRKMSPFYSTLHLFLVTSISFAIT